MNPLGIKYLFARTPEGYYNEDDDWIESDESSDDWEDNYHSDDDYGIQRYEALGHCCGAGTHEAWDTKIISKYGIDLFPGVCGDGESTHRHQKAHIHTRNGDITICIRISPWKAK